MNIETFSKWLTRQGYQVFCSTSRYWYNAGPRVLQAFPYHWLIEPSPGELRSLTLRNGNIALRYSTPFNSECGIVSYHVVLTEPYDMNILRSQARNGVRRGLDHCRVEQISMERLAYDGWRLQQDTLERQGRQAGMSEREWYRVCLSAQDLPGFEAWAAIVDGELGATLLITRIDDTAYVPYAQSKRCFLNLHVNNALFYEASRAMLSRPGIKRIFFSLHSLDAPESINEFKFRMGLMARPVRQCVYFNPIFRPLANHHALKILSWWKNRSPDNVIVAKAEGMLKFYLNGKQSLVDQEWPACLSEFRKHVIGMPVVQDRENAVRLQTEP